MAPAVYDLVVHPRDPELVTGKHGRSIFVTDITMIREAANERKMSANLWKRRNGRRHGNSNREDHAT